MSIKSVAFDHPTSAGACGVGQAWARVPAPQSPDQQRQAADRLRRLLRERDAVMIAHYYVDGPLQDLARETGGCVGDSLEMARFGASHPRPPWWWPVCVSWARPPRSSARTSAC